MLRVAEQYSGTDTGRQRRANEDSLFARAPLFAVADGMGGAQAGEVASQLAVEVFRHGLGDEAATDPEGSLTARAQEANSRIYELSQSNAEHAGMGTTLTVAYVGEDEVSVAHVGDSRAYCLRDGELLRLTDDHSLVDELMRQGKLTPEEAQEHPQRSIITRALGPEPAVEVDTRTHRARAGDLYLLCSDGLTTMVPEARLAEILSANESLRDTGEALLAAANEAGGRDNITVVLFRLDDAESLRDDGQHTTLTDVPAPTLDGHAELLGHEDPSPGASAVGHAPTPGVVVKRRRPRMATAPSAQRPRRRLRRLVPAMVLLGVLAVVLSGAYLACQSIYFIATNSRGLVTIYNGLPFSLPGEIHLYSQYYVSGVPASSIPPSRRHTLLDHSWRSESNASELVHSLELGQLSD
ncbi:MAG TPA: Stp1/IreP family PP2C-type Ser/Thr phosphatase [Solirubrobacteraceae bacterium]